MLIDPDLPGRLRARLAAPLPGPDAHMTMAPRHPQRDRWFIPEEGVRRAAVMLLLYRRSGIWHLPFIVRPEHMAHHGGQIAFPGGRVEDGESVEVAARRELMEELGLTGEVEMIGCLTDFYVAASKYLVTPWVGVHADDPVLAPDPGEVAEVVEVPLAHLVDHGCLGDGVFDSTIGPIEAPCFVWKSHRIWGATSMMLSEFLHVLREP